MALDEGTYVVSLYGWSRDTLSHGRSVRLSISQDGRSRSVVEFGVHGPGFDQVLTAAVPIPGASPEGRAQQGLLLVAKSRIEESFASGVMPPAALSFQPAELDRASAHVSEARDLAVSLALDSVLLTYVECHGDRHGPAVS